MTIPPQRLLDVIQPRIDLFELRDSSGLLLDRITWSDAYSRAVRDEIEGVATASERIRYFRVLPESQRPKPAEEAEEIHDSKSTAFANTNMGVYRERVREAVMADSCGFRKAVASGEITGFVWAFCQGRS